MEDDEPYDHADAYEDYVGDHEVEVSVPASGLVHAFKWVQAIIDRLKVKPE